MALDTQCAPEQLVLLAVQAMCRHFGGSSTTSASKSPTTYRNVQPEGNNSEMTLMRICLTFPKPELRWNMLQIMFATVVGACMHDKVLSDVRVSGALQGRITLDASTSALTLQRLRRLTAPFGTGDGGGSAPCPTCCVCRSPGEVQQWDVLVRHVALHNTPP